MRFLIVERDYDEVYVPDKDDYVLKEFTNVYESDDYLKDVQSLNGYSWEIFTRLDNGKYIYTASIYHDDLDDDDDDDEE